MRKSLNYLPRILLLAASIAAQSLPTFQNPLLRTAPDPWVIFKDGFYYQTNSSGNSLFLRKTREITELRRGERRIIWTPPPNMPYSHELWSPELHFIEGKWYMYFAADAGTNESHRIWVLENSSADPLSLTWVFKGQLTDPTDKWADDPTVFEQAGNLYAIWAGWKGDRNGTENLYIAQMANPWTIEGKRVKLSSPQYAWEKIGSENPPFVAVNEAPEILKHEGKIYLVYSASGCWTDHYGLGMLTAQADADLLNPKSWKKSRESVFSTSPQAHAYGPGHAGFLQSADGTQNWFYYHANPEPNQGCDNHRSLRLQPFTWNPDGSPNFGRPVPLGESLPKPTVPLEPQ